MLPFLLEVDGEEIYSGDLVVVHLLPGAIRLRSRHLDLNIDGHGELLLLLPSQRIYITRRRDLPIELVHLLQAPLLFIVYPLAFSVMPRSTLLVLSLPGLVVISTASASSLPLSVL